MKKQNEMVNLFKMTLTKDQRIEVIYEDLICDTKNVLRHLVKTLKIELPVSKLKNHQFISLQG
jgi:hypothetical protein